MCFLLALFSLFNIAFCLRIWGHSVCQVCGVGGNQERGKYLLTA
uniref:Uncharacterized protein n=1 Tax=Anguilla anguilla TaxID=7936 RepID=A0A0E9VUV2_ANGAN